MTTAQDLRDLRDQLDGALTGWPWPSSIKASTKIGAECLDLVHQLRKRRYKDWAENCVLRARLSAALKDNEGQREMNAILTAELERVKS
jgi:hypothetical protein